MYFSRLAVVLASLLTVGCFVGCSGGSSSGSASEVSSDFTAPASSSPAPASLSSPRTPSSSDTPPTVPNEAVMAARIVVDSGEFAGTSVIQSTGTVGCSFNLFGDSQWRISFSAEGEFASQDTTTKGRPVVSFGLATQKGGTANLSITYTSSQQGSDLDDPHGAAVVQDNGSTATFTYAGQHADGTKFHGAANCTKILRHQ